MHHSRTNRSLGDVCYVGTYYLAISLQLGIKVAWALPTLHTTIRRNPPNYLCQYVSLGYAVANPTYEKSCYDSDSITILDNIVFILLTDSIYSRSGTDSPTIPAPALS